jgi:leader peptidase (prepilin peptidase) / N-methyltransferase
VLIAALVCAFVLGTCAGSFLGVVVHRMPRGLSIVSPPSRCGSCGTSLGLLENIPVLGWLMLRGRCRHCGSPIPASCLYMELGVGAITAAVAWAALSVPLLHSRFVAAASVMWCDPSFAVWLPQLAALIPLLLVTWLLIAAVLIDWEHLIIPDELSKGLQVVAIPLAALTGSNLIWPWNPQWWFRTWDVMGGWVGTPETAAWRLGIVAVLGLGLIAASLPLARRIYGGIKDAWEERDHRAMAMGAWWFIGCTTLWIAATVALVLWLGPGALSSDYHPGRLLAIALTQAILGAIAGWWLPWLVGLVGTVAFKRNAMGYGDVKLFCALGAFLGPVGTIAAFAWATVVGTVIGIPARLLGGGREMPFGPSLAIGAVLAIAFGPWLAPRLVMHLLG